MWHFLWALQRRGSQRSMSQLRHGRARRDVTLRVMHTRLWKKNALWIDLKIVFHVLSILVSSLWIHRRITYQRAHTHTQTHAHLRLRYFTLFILSRLILERHFLWSPIYVSSQAAPPRLPPTSLISLCLVSLSPSTCTLNETMVLSSNERWVCQVLKGGEDKWREGTGGCEDNGFFVVINIPQWRVKESMTVLLCHGWQQNEWKSRDRFRLRHAG